MKAPLIAALLFATSSVAAAPECGEALNFPCIQDYAKSQLDRLGLMPNGDQNGSIRAIGALQTYLDGDPKAAVAAFENDGLAVYDLLFALTIARQTDDVEKAIAAAENPGIVNAKGEAPEGDDAVAQMKRDVFNWHGDDDGPYVALCNGSEDEFTALLGSMERKGACTAPYDARAVRRVFGVFQLRRGLSSPDAFRAVMEYAYRKGECVIASAVLEASHHWSFIGHDEETAAWHVIDVATLCAAELLDVVKL